MSTSAAQPATETAAKNWAKRQIEIARRETLAALAAAEAQVNDWQVSLAEAARY